MVVLHAVASAGRWFGVACSGEALVATAVDSRREGVLTALRRGLPPGTEHRVGDEETPAYVQRTVALLVELESGEESRKSFTLSSEYVADTLARVLRAAAAIPLGYVTSYGEVAKLAGVEPREVGGIMAANPLYPIVACHRVVGADLSLVGYAGSRGRAALEAKLARLSGEARGFTAEKEVPVGAGVLRVYPVEWAIAKARRPGADRQRKLFD